MPLCFSSLTCATQPWLLDFLLTLLKPFHYASRKYKYCIQNFGVHNLVRSSITHLVKQFRNGTVVHYSFANTYLEYIVIEFLLNLLILKTIKRFALNAFNLSQPLHHVMRFLFLHSKRIIHLGISKEFVG